MDLGRMQKNSRINMENYYLKLPVELVGNVISTYLNLITDDKYSFKILRISGEGTSYTIKVVTKKFISQDCSIEALNVLVKNNDIIILKSDRLYSGKNSTESKSSGNNIYIENLMNGTLSYNLSFKNFDCKSCGHGITDYNKYRDKLVAILNALLDTYPKKTVHFTDYEMYSQIFVTNYIDNLENKRHNLIY